MDCPEPFPVNICIDDVREAIAGRDDFREVKYSDYSAFVYFLGVAKDIFPDPNTAPDARTALLWKLRRECRGLIFDSQGQIIARRFHKFFNINETPETQCHLIDLTKEFIITEKLDGSLISPFWTEGRLRFATKQGVTDTTLLAEKFIEKTEIPYVQFCTAWIAKGFTPIFEYCSPDRPIVLAYKEESLKLLALRNMKTGIYLPYPELESAAVGMPVVKSWKPEDLGIDEESRRNFSAFEQSIKKTEGLEGFVICFSSGLMLKIKTNWYFSLNKSLDKIKNCSERHLWISILSEQYDDVKVYLPPDLRVSTDAFSIQLDESIHSVTTTLMDLINANIKLEGKPFADWAARDPTLVALKASKLAFQIKKAIEKEEPKDHQFIVRQIIVKYVLGHANNAKSFKQWVLPLLKGLKFNKPNWFKAGLYEDDS